MNTPDTNKTSEQLHREAREQIDKISAGIDQARARLSPGNLLDDAIFYPRGQSLTATYGHLKRNPVGTMFLSLGTLLLMEDERGRTYEEAFRLQASEAIDKSRESIRHAKESVSEAGSEISERFREQGHKAMDRINKAKEDLSSKGEELKRKAKESVKNFDNEAQETAGGDIGGRAQDGMSKAREGVDSAKHQAKEGVDRAKRRAQEGLESARSRLENAPALGEVMHPFAIASMGLGLGATLGASFPMRRLEDKLKSERFQQRMSQLNEEFEYAIRESGERIKNHLIDELKSFNFH